MQQHHQMMGINTGHGGSSTGAGGYFEPNRGGLTRFRSAPATRFDTLIQDGEITRTQFLPQVSTTSSTSKFIRNSSDFAPADTSFGSGDTDGTGYGFFRQNCSPTEMLAQFNSTSGFVCDGFFSTSKISANNQNCVSKLEIPSNNQEKDLKSDQGLSRQNSANFSSQLRRENSVPLPARMDSLSDMEMDKLFEDSVPCGVRAKRGFATHPRSIAERVRRTKISDRIRKLQELVPNMDMQTNTADMLDEAVEYVKSLQKQIQELSEHQKKCTCIAKD